MRNELQMLTDRRVKHEFSITALELLEEIKPLLDDYFVGEICLLGNAIAYQLPNGQTFYLKAEAIA